MSYGAGVQKWKPYPAYKDSGVEWLGQVPEEWGTGRVAFGYEVVLGKMLQPNPRDENDQQTLYYRAINIQWEKIVGEQHEMWASPDEIKKYSIQKGDLLVCEGGDVGRAALVPFEVEQTAIIQNALHRVRAYKEYDARFLLRVLQHATSADWFTVLCNKATIAHFTGEKFKGLGLPVPSLPEQQAIAAFLDRECGRIDELIEKKRRLLELLEEKRRAVITQAVTRGLDPHAPMKDSGVEWIGVVPEGWEVKRLRFLSRINPARSEVSLQPGALVSFAPMDAVGEYGGMLCQEKALDEVGSGYTYFINDDVLVAKITPCFENGKGALAEKLANGVGFGSTEFHVIRSLQALSPHFLFYFSISVLFRRLGEAYMYGAGGQKRIPDAYIRDLYLPTPSGKEQQAIAEYLDSATAAIDAQRQAHEKSIALLQEYRASLITHAVTGKIDVRHCAPQP